MKYMLILSGLLILSACTSSAELPLRTTDTLPGEDAGIEEGTVAPDFVALAHDDRHIALSELRGRTVILFFFTKDETPLARKELLDFRNVARTLESQGIMIIGVSSDPPETHRAFAKELGVSYPLLSDPNGNLARVFGVPFRYGLADRRTFIIGPSGTIERIFRDVVVPRHVKEVMAAVSPKRK